MDKKSEIIKIRLTFKNKILLESLAKTYNMNLSDFLRWMIEEKAKELFTKEIKE